MTTIGLTGVARAGKDTFCQLLIEELAKKQLVAKRFALADKLKKDLESFIFNNYGIDVFYCTPEQKELIREFLVFHGKMKRITSQGTYWTGELKPLIDFSDIDVAIVTDLRYAIFPKDELNWIKEVMNGTLVHISRFVKKPICYGDFVAITDEEHKQGFIKTYIEPPNKDERENDPLMKAGADFLVDWESGDIEQFCRPEVVKFVQYLEDKKLI